MKDRVKYEDSFILPLLFPGSLVAGLGLGFLTRGLESGTASSDKRFLADLTSSVAGFSDNGTLVLWVTSLFRSWPLFSLSSSFTSGRSNSSLSSSERRTKSLNYFRENTIIV